MEKNNKFHKGKSNKIVENMIEFLLLRSIFRPSSNQCRTGIDLQSEFREMDRIWCRLYLRQTIGKHLARSHLNKTHSPVAHSICCRKNAFNSMCLVLRVDPLRLITPSAAEETQHKICCDASVDSSSLHPNCSSQFHCCRRPMPSQAPESSATKSASTLLSAIVDCFSARCFDRVPAKFTTQPRRSSTLAESISVTSPV